MPYVMRYNRFTHLEQLKDFSEHGDRYFFTPDTMRYFGSRISAQIHHGNAPEHWNYFVSSERGGAHADSRRFTVRRLTEDGAVITVGEYRQYTTSRAAHKAIERIIADANQTPVDPARLFAWGDFGGVPHRFKWYELAVLTWIHDGGHNLSDFYARFEYEDYKLLRAYGLIELNHGDYTVRLLPSGSDLWDRWVVARAAYESAIAAQDNAQTVP